MNIPPEYQGSAALQFIQSRGWNWKPSNAPNVELEICPYCDKDGYGHCYVEIRTPQDDAAKRDGLHTCHRCGKGGSLYSLKEHLGVVIAGVQSRKDWAGNEQKVEPLPDIDAAHQALLEDEAAMDYLMNGRGFSREIIERQKIGLATKRFFRECGEVRALIYPYLVNGNCVYVHFRTLPTMPLSENKIPKAFNSPMGWEAPLYNGEVLREGVTEIFMVEGEANCIAAMDHGVENICGAPGANFKKAEWIDTLDKLQIEKVYICYDKDQFKQKVGKVGQKAAQALASRIGVEKCWKITLPDFMVTTDEGETRPGKDLNEWFAVGGGTSEEFERLKKEAVLFDVDGVHSTKDALQELYDQFDGKESAEAPYKFPWASLNKYVRIDYADVIDIVAKEKIGKTTFGMNLIEYAVDTYGEDGIIICLDMTPEKVARKWVAHKAQIADNIPQTPEEGRELKAKFMEAIPRLQRMDRPGTLYFCYPKYRAMDDLYKLIREVIRRYGVKWIMFDNLQKACDTTLGGKNRTVHLSEISKIMSQIAKDYVVQIIRIIQPGKVVNRLTTTDDVDGASQISKDCDAMLTLNRNRVNEMSAEAFESCGYIESDASFDDKMLVGIGLSRYSSGGGTTLHYDGARSTVNEYDIAKIAVIKAAANKDVGYAAQKASLGIAQSVPPQADAAAPIQADDVTAEIVI